MNKTALIMVYGAFILVMLSLFFGTGGFLGLFKLLVLACLSLLVLGMTTKSSKSVYTVFNVIFGVSVSLYVLYVLFFLGILFAQVRIMFFLGALLGLAMALHYTPKRKKMLPPPRPVYIKREVKPVKQTVSTAPIAKKAVKKSPKRKTTKKKVTKKKVAKKKVVKKTTKKKSTTKKVTKRSGSRDANLISFSKDHEVAYLLRKHKKRITKDNKAILVAEGKKFKSMKSYKPHNRESFYNYMKKYKTLSKLK